MRFTLKDYQQDAVSQSLNRLRRARTYFRMEREQTAFSLSATTGAGKTVMAAAVIEALFNGNDDLGFAADPSAVVLWFSDDPSLNEQTRFRLLQAAGDTITHGQLVVVDYPFPHRKLSPGHVYFLNTQKLSKSSLLVRGHRAPEDQLRLPASDLQPFSFWDTIRETVEDSDRTLYLMLDEAHRGLGGQSSREASERSTIVRTLINGQADVPPIPVVMGISATVERFTRAMDAATDRTTLPPVTVDPALVQASGLLKDDILLDIPAETGTFDNVLLVRGTERLIASSAAWAAYAAGQGVGADHVVPLLVVQVPNTPSDKLLEEIVRTVRMTWTDLPDDAIAYVFGDHNVQKAGPFVIPYIEPQRVQESIHVRVLLAKDAISTGWDCPRAEVMVSFRPASDETHITQLLGRMVRNPLARRIPGDERLNSVACILPRFNRASATRVARRLMNTGDPTGPEAEGAGETGGGAGRRVLINPVDMLPNPELPEAIWECFEALPGQSLPRRTSSPVRRLTELAQLLVNDGLLPDAGKQAHRELHGVLDGIRAQHKGEMVIARNRVLTVEAETIRATRGDSEIKTTGFTLEADDRIVGDAYKAAGRILNGDLSRTYVDHIAGPAEGENDSERLRDAWVEIGALGLLEGVQDDLQRAADRIADRWFDQHRVAIKGLTGERQQEYNRVRADSVDPEPQILTRPHVRQEETMDVSGQPLPTAQLHLLCDTAGDYPIGSLNAWEREVLASEMKQRGVVAWYRNPSRASQDALAISYRDGSGEWRSLRPDFLVFDQSANGTIQASIVDPHGTHLADAMPKLRGLADYAETLGSGLTRIDSIAEVDGAMRVLDLTDAVTREAVRAAPDAAKLFASSVARAYI